MEFGYPTVQERLLRTRKSLFTLRRSDRPAKIGETAMTLSDCLASGPVFMEGALGERLKREYGLAADGIVGEDTWNRITSVYSSLSEGRGTRFGQFPGYIVNENGAG